MGKRDDVAQNITALRSTYNKGQQSTDKEIEIQNDDSKFHSASPSFTDTSK